LAAFLREELAHEEMQQIGVHLTDCAGCGSTIRELDQVESDPFRAFLVDGSGIDEEAAQDPWFQDMVAAAVRAFSEPESEADETHPERVGQYQLYHRLGRGGMGVVYRAQHLQLKKWVAVKLLPPNRVTDARVVRRFQHEMEVVGRLDHPNIVRATDAGFADGFHYLAMELIEGRTLTKLVREQGPLAVPLACDLILQTAVGLQHAHEHKLVHRDIKPSNIMISLKGEVKLLDLGLALLRSEQTVSRLSASGMVMGTSDYMAPEQWEASHAVDIRADIYSLGCTLYYLLAGQAPFDQPEYEPILRKMEAVARVPAPCIRSTRPDVPEELATILTRMLAKNPADRYQTPEEVVQALKPFTRETGFVPVARLSGETATLAVNCAAVPLTQSTVDYSPGKQDATQAVPQRRLLGSRRRKLGIGALALLLASVLGASFLLPPKAEVKKPRTFAIGEWHDLLEEPPTEFHWFNSEGRSHRWHDPKTKKMGVQAQQLTLLGLGQTDKPFILRLTLRQQPWTGGVGIFFGGKPGQQPGMVRFEWVELRGNPAGAKPPFNLNRSWGTAQMRPLQMPQVVEVDISTQKLTNQPENKDCTLEIEVTRRGLEHVSWNGVLHDKLITGAINPPKNNACHGVFGVYCRESSVTIHKAQYFPTE